MPFIEESIWLSREPRVAGAPPVPGLVLDRDGVLVREVHYLSRPQDVALEDGVVELLTWAAANGIPVGVATNQAGIDRGKFGWDAYRAVERRIDELLGEAGVAVGLTVACPYHPQHRPEWNDHHERWRKPGPAMLHLLASDLGLDLKRSWMIGDKDSDVAAARAAGMAGAVHVLTGHGPEHRDRCLALATPSFAVVSAAGVREALAELRGRFA